MTRPQNGLTARIIKGLLAVTAGTALASNLSITNITVNGNDTTTAYVTFDLQWDNSWRYTNINHDAAWVFFKVLPDGQTDWQPVILEGTGINPTGYQIGSGTPVELIVPPDRMGLFVRRSSEGSGTTSVQNIRAMWNFSSNNAVITDKVLVQAFAVEMVFVAEGSFQVGDGTTTKIRGHFEAGTSGSPFTITNESYAITLGGGGAGSLGNNHAAGMGAPSDDFNDSTTKTLPGSFPKGYAGFYCMKYEITEGQWVDFFNTLTTAQKATRDITDITGKNSDGVVYRNTVAYTSGNATSTRRDRACGYLSWADVVAFADWAGLRPMSELEFEKACRGPLTAVADEFAWGTTTIMLDASRSLSGSENGTETITSDLSSGGCNYGNKAHTGGDAGTGPLRVGIFATNGSTRISAGASYWGIMELSGNLFERPVSVGNATGRSFTGAHGNGALNATGNADVTGWPTADSIGTSFRGGDFSYVYEVATSLLRVSDRYFGSAGNQTRIYYFNGRAVRTGPPGVGP